MMLEDETGTSRVIISPDFYDENRMVVLNQRFVVVSGVVQNQVSVVHLKAHKTQPMAISAAVTPPMIFIECLVAKRLKRSGHECRGYRNGCVGKWRGVMLGE